MSYGFTAREAAAYDQWKTTPPDEDRWGSECPDCGCDIEKDGYGFKCSNEKCDWCAYPEDIEVEIPEED